MKHILFLTLALATVALLSGCATDGHGSRNHDQSQFRHDDSHDAYEQELPSTGGGGY